MDSAQDVTYEKCEERLGTFNIWPKESPALIKELVDAGFFYSGTADLVTCFACGIKIGEWHEGDNPLEKHERENIECSYLAERALRKAQLQNLHSECGTTLENLNDAPESDDTDLENVENRKSSIKKMGQSLSNKQIQEIVDAGLFYNQSSDVFECYACHTQFDVPELLESEDPVACHKDKYLPCSHIAIVTGDQECNVPEPSTEPREPPLLSLQASKPQNENRAGGFYESSDSMLQNESSDRSHMGGVKPRQNKMENKLKVKIPNSVDKTQANSGNRISTVESQGFNSEAYACAMPHRTAHQRYFDSHPGSASPDLSGNNSPAFRMSPRVSMGSEAALFGRQFSRQSSNRSMSSDDEIPNLEFQTNFPLQLPSKKAMLKTKYGRLQTFLTWPTDAKIQPQALSEAGFYYMGEDDGVVCYKCEIRLRNWEIGDDAWTEHKRWSQNCPLVIEHDAQAARNERQMGNSENRQSMRRQFDRVQHNFYDMRTQIPPDIQYPVPMSSLPFRHFDSRYPEPVPIPSSIPIMGFGNIFHPPLINSSQILPEQQDFLRNEPSPIYDNRNVKEPQEVERIGPLEKKDFDTLLDVGFSIETINNVQKLAHEKYGEYLDSVETVGDAIVHFLENGNLDEHSIPKEGNSGEQNNTKSSKHLDLKRELDKVREMQLCKICMDEQVGAAFHPCGHLFTCPRCAKGLEQCPLCRAHIESTSRVYLS